jgi:hypothetical protein
MLTALCSRDASNNYYERLITRNNYETGFQIQGTHPPNARRHKLTFSRRGEQQPGRQPRQLRQPRPAQERRERRRDWYQRGLGHGQRRARVAVLEQRRRRTRFLVRVHGQRWDRDAKKRVFREFLSPVTIENCYSWGNGFNRCVPRVLDRPLLNCGPDGDSARSRATETVSSSAAAHATPQLPI